MYLICINWHCEPFVVIFGISRFLKNIGGRSISKRWWPWVSKQHWIALFLCFQLCHWKISICKRAALNQFIVNMKAVKGKKRLTEHQSGNKARHSTGTMNVMMTDKFLEAMDKKMLTLMVLLDLWKVFDIIGHANLLAKLSSLEVSSSALEWFNSYMHDRLQYPRGWFWNVRNA